MRFLIIIFLIFIFGIFNLAVVSVGFLLIFNILFKDKKVWVFLTAFLLGVVLDILTLRPFGQTSFFLIICVFVVFLYSAKFEIQTGSFIFISAFLGTASYLLIFGYAHILTQGIISAILTVLTFNLIQKSILRQT